MCNLHVYDKITSQEERWQSKLVAIASDREIIGTQKMLFGLSQVTRESKCVRKEVFLAIYHLESQRKNIGEKDRVMVR